MLAAYFRIAAMVLGAFRNQPIANLNNLALPAFRITGGARGPGFGWRAFFQQAPGKKTVKNPSEIRLGFLTPKNGARASLTAPQQQLRQAVVHGKDHCGATAA
jgi:hypothetical protein